MTKVATSWTRNPAKTAGVAYSSAAMTYNSSTTSFSSSTTALADSGKLPDAWTLQAKTPSAFVVNPAAHTNLDTFDSALETFDSSSLTFDGVVSGQEFGNSNAPAAWTKASKTASSWQANPAASVNQRVHDSTALYDVAATNYDGVVAGVETLANKQPSVWSQL